MFWRRRRPTIGDWVADSIAEQPGDWMVDRPGPFDWRYTNAKRGWRLLHYCDVRTSFLTFEQCTLTWRERRRVMKALNRWHADRRRERREHASRRAQLRVVS